MGTYLNGLYNLRSIITRRETISGIAGPGAFTVLTGPDAQGWFPLDASMYQSFPTLPDGTQILTTTFRFVAGLWVSVAGQTVTCNLVNVTAGGALVASLTATATTPQDTISAPLVVGVDLPSSRQLYEIQLIRTGGTSTNKVFAGYAGVEVSYT